MQLQYVTLTSAAIGTTLRVYRTRRSSAFVMSSLASDRDLTLQNQETVTAMGNDDRSRSCFRLCARRRMYVTFTFQ